MSDLIKLKWVYDPGTGDDGQRILVDRLWPRGVTKERLDIVYWAKDIAPSNELRKWYGHDPAKWEEFRARYTAELRANPEGIRDLLAHLESGHVSFLYSSKEHQINNAVVLREYVSPMLK